MKVYAVVGQNPEGNTNLEKVYESWKSADDERMRLLQVGYRYAQLIEMEVLP